MLELSGYKCTYNAGIKSFEVVNKFRFLDGTSGLVLVHLQYTHANHLE